MSISPTPTPALPRPQPFCPNYRKRLEAQLGCRNPETRPKGPGPQTACFNLSGGIEGKWIMQWGGRCCRGRVGSRSPRAVPTQPFPLGETAQVAVFCFDFGCLSPFPWRLPFVELTRREGISSAPAWRTAQSPVQRGGCLRGVHVSQ